MRHEQLTVRPQTLWSRGAPANRPQAPAVPGSSRGTDQDCLSPPLRRVDGRLTAPTTGTQQQGWLLGANYVTSNAVNQLEMFQAGTYDPRRIAGELSVARRIGLNTMRVFLHDQLWATDRAGFSSRLSEFVAIAASHNIKPLFVLFDSCWDPLPKAGRQRAPIKGVHNSGWVQSPGAHRLQDPAYTRVLQSYVTGVVGLFRNDPRVLGWDVWNEPDNPVAGLPQGRTRGQAGTGCRVPPARLPVGARRQSGSAVDQRRVAGPLERIPEAAARSAACSSSTRTSSASTATAIPPSSRPASTNSLRWDDRSSAPSIWRGNWAAPWKEFCRSPRGATSALTTGGSSLGGRRHICHGIRGSEPYTSLPETWFSDLHPPRRTGP